MKNGFRASMAWLHTWAGLVVGWVLFFIFVTGAVSYFEDALDAWMQAEAPVSTGTDPRDMVAHAQRWLETQDAGAERWNINLPLGAAGLGATTISTAPDGRALWRSTHLDVFSGKPLADGTLRASGGGKTLRRMHYHLHYLPRAVAIRLVGVCTMIMLVALVTGVIIHKKIFADFFTFRPGKGQRSWMDAHNAVSVWALPFFLMITYSGLMFFPMEYMPAAMLAAYRGDERAYRQDARPERRPEPSGIAAPVTPLAPLIDAAGSGGRPFRITVFLPGDRAGLVMLQRLPPPGSLLPAAPLFFRAADGVVIPDPAPPTAGLASTFTDTLLALHAGAFAGPVLRWLYFGSGLLGCAMIATGLILWTVKRRARHEKKSRGTVLGLCFVERLNIGVLVGLPVGIAAYFWANRLLPVALLGRADWEAHTLFLAWAGMLLHATLRPIRQAWTESLWLATAAFGLIPLVNWLSTGKHLGATIPHGDWMLAGVDLTMLALAATFGTAAWKLARRWRTVPEGEMSSAR